MTMFSELGHQHLHQYYQHLLRLRAGALSSDDPEAIHQMRVAARRLRVVLNTFADCYPQKPSRKMTRQVKRLQRALGSVRDADVLLGQLQNEQEHAPANQHPGINLVIQQLKEQRAADFQVLQQRLRKRQVERLEATFQETLRPCDPLDRPPTFPPPQDPPWLQPENSLAGCVAKILSRRL